MSELQSITSLLSAGHTLTRTQYMALPRLLAEAPPLPVETITLPDVPPKSYPKPFDATGQPCTAPANLNLFFGEDNEPQHERVVRERRAKKLCGQCALQPECRDYALAHETKTTVYGVSGGMTERERSDLIRQREQEAARQ